MSGLINGRTPEEIKYVLEWSSFSCAGLDCDVCTYNDVCSRTNLESAASDALALIQHLEAQQPKWISVKERLPEERDIYLAHIVHRHNRSDSYWCVCVEYFNPEDGWSSLSDLYEVTHWMPLPEPPEEEA